MAPPTFSGFYIAPPPHFHTKLMVPPPHFEFTSSASAYVCTSGKHSIALPYKFLIRVFLAPQKNCDTWLGITGDLLCHEGVLLLFPCFCYVHVVKDRSKAVPTEKFGEHVQRMHADRDKWFEMEYTVSESTKSQWKIAFVCSNKNKGHVVGVVYNY